MRNLLIVVICDTNAMLPLFICKSSLFIFQKREQIAPLEVSF